MPILSAIKILQKTHKLYPFGYIKTYNHTKESNDLTVHEL